MNNNYKEIVTKAVIGKSKKSSKDDFSILIEENISNVLGCWVINHSYKGYNSNGKVAVNGSYDVNNKVDVTRQDSIDSKYDDISPYATTKELGLSDPKTPTKPSPIETPIYDNNGNKTHVSLNGDIYAVVQKDKDSKDSSKDSSYIPS